MCGSWAEPWLAVEMCGQGDQAPCVPRLQCPVWLKPRVWSGKIRDPEKEALRPKKCMEQARAGAQGRLPWAQCVHTAQGRDTMCRGPLVSVWLCLFPFETCMPEPLASRSQRNTPGGGGWGSLGRKLNWKWFEPQSPHPVGGAVKAPGCQGPGHMSVCGSPQSCWSDSSPRGRYSLHTPGEKVDWRLGSGVSLARSEIRRPQSGAVPPPPPSAAGGAGQPRSQPHPR